MLNLYETRVLSRQTQHVLAKKTGISQTRICLIEKGFANPKEADKKRIARALSLRVIDIDWLEEEVEDVAA